MATKLKSLEHSRWMAQLLLLGPKGRRKGSPHTFPPERPCAAPGALCRRHHTCSQSTPLTPAYLVLSKAFTVMHASVHHSPISLEMQELSAVSHFKSSTQPSRWAALALETLQSA